jgi:hypothetical protein
LDEQLVKHALHTKDNIQKTYTKDNTSIESKLIFEEIVKSKYFSKLKPEFIQKLCDDFSEEDFFVEGNAPDDDLCKVFEDTLYNQSLIPLDGSIIEGNSTVTFSGGNLYLKNEDMNLEDLWKTDPDASWDCDLDLSRHRGIGIEVKGDGSGAILLVNLAGTGTRDYVIPIDFEGWKYIEIPNGEVSWAMEEWGWRMHTKCMDYNRVQKVNIGLGKVPANHRVSIIVRNMRALAEFAESRSDAVLNINDKAIPLAGGIYPGDYIYCDGSNAVTVYDYNWQLQKSYKIINDSSIVKAGENKISVSSESLRSPWMEAQFFVKGEAIQ